MDAKLRKEIDKLKEDVKLLQERRIHQTMIIPGAIKRRHLEDKVIVFGIDRPTDDSTGISVYFNTSTGVLSMWDGDTWQTYALIPTSPTVYTQTYDTTYTTNPVSTFVDVALTAVTQTTPWGFATQAQGDAISVELNHLGDEVINIKQLINALIDDLQAVGLVG